ncbi:MAG: hypothetical protein IPF92_25760 [Myxococcales bacterium]|jgi:hypothetical protein|nr:hypothetical protein [Myxococcales bacterium]MBL0195678.1 hypothetical protein [Myxococcales bacterium]HQY59988.1 hypothetical protein [Polyangiaceae bacterium]
MKLTAPARAVRPEPLAPRPVVVVLRVKSRVHAGTRRGALDHVGNYN